MVRFVLAEEQHRLPSSQAVLNTVVVRLGGLMVLMLTVGRWADVLHILICFLGEASCLIPTMELLDSASSQVSESPRKQHAGLTAFSAYRESKLGQNIKGFIRLVPKIRPNFSNLCPRWRRLKLHQTDSGQSFLWFRVLSLFFLYTVQGCKHGDIVLSQIKAQKNSFIIHWPQIASLFLFAK